MTIFGYPLAEVKKFLLALALFVGTGLAFVLHFDPKFGVALEVLAGNGVAVLAVFAAPQFSIQDLSKAVAAAIASLFSVLNFFTVVNASTQTEILTFVGYGVAVFGIWYIGNAGHRTVKSG